MMRFLHSILHLSWAERWLLGEALLLLGCMRAAVLTLPLRWLMRQLHQQVGAISTTVDDPATVAQRKQIAWALAVASCRTPWCSNCLTQALAGTIMLRRRKLTSTLYLGVSKGVDREVSTAAAGTKETPAQFNAHAWLRSGNMILTGDGPLKRFAILTTFSDAPSPHVDTILC